MSHFRVENHPVVFLKPRLSYPYAWVGHVPFAYLLVDLLRPRSLVELGTDSGNSYLAFCQAVVELGTETRCTAIDTWEGDPHARRYGESVYETLKRYHDPRYASFSRMHRSLFIDALPEFEDASIDLLHIDGLHTYEAVREDFTTWLPKLSDRAVVIFHDSQVRGRGFGVSRFLDEIRARYRIVEFEHSNGLAIAQVGEHAPEAFIEFLEAFDDHPVALRRFFKEMGDALISHGERPTGARSEQVTPEVTCRVYYRDEMQEYDDSRAVMAELTDPQGPLALEFSFPEGVRPSAIRLDPADHAGVFDFSSLGLSVGTHRTDIDRLAERIGHISGDLTSSGSEHSLRLVSFGDDPNIEFSVADLVQSLPKDGVLSLSATVGYEVVLNSPVFWPIAKVQNKALQELKGRLRSEAVAAAASVAAPAAPAAPAVPAGASLADIGTVVGAMHVAGVLILPGRGPSLYGRQIGDVFTADRRVRGELIGLDDVGVIGFDLANLANSPFIRIDGPALAGTYHFSGLTIAEVPVVDLRRRIIATNGQLIDGRDGDSVTIASPHGPPQIELDVSDLSIGGMLSVVVSRDLSTPWIDAQRLDDTSRLERRIRDVERAAERDRLSNLDHAEAIELRQRRAADKLEAFGEQMLELRAQTSQLHKAIADLTYFEQNRSIVRRIVRRIRRMFG